MSSSFEKEAYSPNPQPLTNLKNHRNCGENVFVYSPGQDYPLCGWWREQQIKTQFYTTRMNYQARFTTILGYFGGETYL